ncbi:hypothetical protein FRC02_001431 [Tulasnella sp. 418]|nr:hypothetical protein FRC02_001431 [Tulasnella sp. 418]
MRFSTVLFLTAATSLLSFTSAAPTGNGLEVRGGCDNDPKCFEEPKCKDKCDDDTCDKCDDDCDDHGGRQCHVKGIDVTYNTDHVEWKKYKFAYILATKGDDYTSPRYKGQYDDCHKSGLYCGAYHVAHPTKCNGDDQAKYFVRHGGDWDKNKKKLPGALSIGCEDEPKDCFGLSASQLVDWIRDFSKTYHSKTDRYPVISTTAKWWKHCTNNSREFKGKNPLWLVGDDETPGHWDHWSFLEYKSPEHDKPGKMKWYSNYDALKSFSNKHD